MIAALRLAIWAALWGLGGLWIARSAFRLGRGEILALGLAVGIAAENLFANLLGRILPLPLAFWLAAGLVCLLGLGLALRDGGRNLARFSFSWGSILGVGLVSLASFAIGRGYAIFDDYMQLSTISTIAAGSIPPHFALDPAVPYDYHFFLLLFSGQLMRVGGLQSWLASDLAHGLTVGLAVALVYAWTRRVTRSQAAAILGAAFLLFGSGARWTLLLLPAGLLRSISAHLSLLGSGAGSGANLGQALLSSWAVEGAGPIPFPFAFSNGILQPGVLNQFSVNGLLETAFVAALLLTFTRWRSPWRAGLASALVLSAMMLLTEVGVALSLGAWGLIALATAIHKRSLRLPKSLWQWLATLLGGHLLGAWQGGALVGVAGQLLGAASETSYHTVAFRLVFPPTVVSAHLGVLSLGSPTQLLAALAELGPLLLVFPLLVAWGLKAFRAGRWLEAALVGEALLSLAMLFVQYAGSEGVRNSSRLYRFLFVLGLFAVPLVWNWVSRRAIRLRWLAASLAGVAMLGGLALFCVEIPAVQKPVLTYFVTSLDKRISDQYWNRLDAGALVFDPTPYRAPTLFGRFTDSSTTWYASKPEWNRLKQDPLPAKLHAAGYSYAYLDNSYFDSLPAAIQSAWAHSCARLMADQNDGPAWRRLYAIQNCH